MPTIYVYIYLESVNMRMMDDRSVLISHHYNGDEFGKPFKGKKKWWEAWNVEPLLVTTNKRVNQNNLSKNK